jgi:hypothetical protein
LIPLTYILINLIQAVWHSYLIRKNRLIQSGQKIIEYSVASILAGVILYSFSGGKLLPLILFCILTRLAFFDSFLNVLRHKPLSYEGEIKKGKSFGDWLENKTGLPIMFLRVVYLAAFLIYLIIWMRQ